MTASLFLFDHLPTNFMVIVDVGEDRLDPSFFLQEDLISSVTLNRRRARPFGTMPSP